MSEAKLFSPLKVGAVTVPNRVFMAPLTRLRSIEPGDIPTPLMGEYYRQRQFRADHHRSDADLRAGQRLRRRAWAAQPGADCRLAENHRRRSCRKRSYRRPAVAHRAYFP